MANRIFPCLPSHRDLVDGAVGFIGDGPPYLPREVKEILAKAFELTPGQRALCLPNGRNAFDNYVDHALRRLTLDGIHTGPNGGKHTSPDELYYPTEYGRSLSRQLLGGHAMSGWADRTSRA